MRFLRSAAALGFVLFMVFLTTPGFSAEPATVRIANATFSENVAALWIGADMGFFKKHGANVEVLQIRTGPLIMAAMASGDLQMAYTAPGPVLSAKASGMDVVFFAGIVNKADGEILREKTTTGCRGIEPAVAVQLNCILHQPNVKDRRCSCAVRNSLTVSPKRPQELDAQLGRIVKGVFGLRW